MTAIADVHPRRPVPLRLSEMLEKDTVVRSPNFYFPTAESLSSAWSYAVTSESELSSDSESAEGKEEREEEDCCLDDEDGRLADDEASECSSVQMHQPARRRIISRKSGGSSHRIMAQDSVSRSPQNVCFASTDTHRRTDDMAMPQYAAAKPEASDLADCYRANSLTFNPQPQTQSTSASSPQRKTITPVRSDRRWSISGSMLTSMPHESLWEEGDSEDDLAMQKLVRRETATRKMLLKTVAAAASQGKLQPSAASPRRHRRVSLTLPHPALTLARSSHDEHHAIDPQWQQEQLLHQQRTASERNLQSVKASHHVRSLSEPDARVRLTGTSSTTVGKSSTRPPEGLKAAVAVVQKMKNSCLRSRFFSEAK